MGWVFIESGLMWLSLERFQGGCQFLLRGDVVLGGVGCGVSLSVILIWRSSFVAQLFGHRHAGWNVKQVLSLSCIINSFGVLVCLLIPVGLLVGAVSLYCHSWCRVFDINNFGKSFFCVGVGKHVTVSRYCQFCTRFWYGRSTLVVVVVVVFCCCFSRRLGCCGCPWRIELTLLLEGARRPLSCVNGCLVFSTDRLMSFKWVGLDVFKESWSSVKGLWSVVVVKIKGVGCCGCRLRRSVLLWLSNEVCVVAVNAEWDFKGVRNYCLVKRSGCCLSWELGCCFSKKFRAVVFQVWTVLLQWALFFLWVVLLTCSGLVFWSFFWKKNKALRLLSCGNGVFFTVAASSTSFIVVDLGILGLAFSFSRFSLCKEALLVFSTTCASVPVEDWASRPSLRSATGTGWNSAGIGRNWPDSDGTCHHQRAGQSPSARTRDRYFCVRRLRKKPRSNNSPDSTQLPVPPCPGRVRFLFRPIPLCGPLPRWPDCASKIFSQRCRSLESIQSMRG